MLKAMDSVEKILERRHPHVSPESLDECSDSFCGFDLSSPFTR